HRHRDFQSRALPTELPGLSGPGRPPARVPGSLTLVSSAVHPVGIGWRSGNAITVAEPVQQVAVLAPATAEGRVLRLRRLAAKRAGLRLVRGSRHTRPTWGERRPTATRPRRQADGRAGRSTSDDRGD